LAELALRHRIASIFGFREWVEAGGLLSYGSSLPAMFRRAADYVGRIAKGAKPADLPIEQPTKFELIVNLRTARAIGITVSPMTLVRADEVIEWVRQPQAGAIQPVEVRRKLRSSVCLVASVARPLATVVAKRTQ
jgi:hypothetical protein